MAMTARLPRKQSFLTREHSDSKLLAGFAALVLLTLSYFTVRIGLTVAELDTEMAAVYDLQRQFRALRDDVKANRMFTDSRFEDVGHRLKALTPPPPVTVEALR
jgi:hypothetical protein